MGDPVASEQLLTVSRPGIPGWTASVGTPALVFDERPMLATAKLVDQLRRKTGIRVLYAVKAMSVLDVMRRLSSYVDGFTVASLFDARLAREVVGHDGFVSIGTPGFAEREMEEIGDLCNHVVLNSLGHLERFRHLLEGRARIGLRINPQISYVHEKRYDPSRPYSKLGVEIGYLTDVLRKNPDLLNGLDGILFHTNCDGEDFGPVQTTVELLVEKLPHVLEKTSWVNLGGGYLITDQSDFSPLESAAKLLLDRFQLTVFIEPGAAFVRRSGNLVGSVIDIIPTEGPTVAVLDTSVNHAPEVFEYELVPKVIGSTDDGPYRYILAGNTCLAGDIFGEYKLPYPLEVGSRVVFSDMGAYTFVKSHTFNGQNLPSLYWVTSDGEVLFRRSYYYADYRSRLE
jgi:carboxynorspermidine decarboxylase